MIGAAEIIVKLNPWLPINYMWGRSHWNNFSHFGSNHLLPLFWAKKSVMLHISNIVMFAFRFGSVLDLIFPSCLHIRGAIVWKRFSVINLFSKLLALCIHLLLRMLMLGYLLILV